MSSILLIGILILLPFESAHAYLDPGTGTALVQLVIAGVAGVMYAGSSYLKTMFAYLRRAPKSAEKALKDEKGI